MVQTGRQTPLSPLQRSRVFSFIFAASIRLRLRGCGRATLRVFGGGPKVNMSRREAASMYATFLCASSCSYFFISPAPQLSSCCVLSSSFSSPLTILTLVWSVLLVFPARVETVQCNVLRDGDSQSCMAATGAVAVHQRSTTLRLQHTGALAQRLTR